MNTVFPMSSPPVGAGIYAITNTKTRQIYIGQSVCLTRRYAEWKSCFQNQIGVKSLVVLEAIRNSDPMDWVFRILIEVPDGDRERLDALEHSTIKAALARSPDLVLNARQSEPTTPSPYHVVGVGSAPKSVITTKAGDPLSTSQAAEFFGIKKDAMKKRLRALRDRGIFELVI